MNSPTASSDYGMVRINLYISLIRLFLHIMRKLITYSLSTVLLVTLFGFSVPPAEEWISLFDGKTLNNWKVNEHPETFSVADGAIVVFGERTLTEKN